MTHNKSLASDAPISSNQHNNLYFAPSLYKQATKAALTSAVLASIVLLSGCSQAEKEDYASEDSYEITQEAGSSGDSLDAAQFKEENLSVENLGSDTEAQLGSEASDIRITGKQLMISASADFEVDDVVKTRNTIETLTMQQGGYVAQSSIANNQIDRQTFVQGDKDITLITYARHANMIVRVPSSKISDFLRQVQKQVKFLNQQQFSAQDVTLDLYREKLSAELNGEMASELNKERLNSDNEKEQAGNVDAISATYSARQREQYAQLERMAIADKVKYSVLELNFSQPNSVYKQITPNLESLIQADQPTFAQQVKQSFVAGWEIIKSVVLGIIMLWWLWLILLVAYGLYRVFRRAMIKNLYSQAIIGSFCLKQATTLLKFSSNRMTIQPNFASYCLILF